MKRVLTVSIIALFGVLLLGNALQAQPNLNFKRVTVNWPTIELYMAVGCNGNPAYNMAQQDFRIFENGVEVKDFTLSCPDPTVRCAISVALVYDASGSMQGSGNAGAKQAGRAFVDLMDGVRDEATLIYFNSGVTVLQQMTTIKPLLYAAVDNLPAGGMTAVWDGCYEGLIELINNGVNPCQAVILLTDGTDNTSTRTPTEIIALANRNRIRVFTIALGASVNATELEMIALLTGGRYYYTANAGQIAAIHTEIMTIILQSFQECYITYDRDCADGAMRAVELQLVNFCGGTDVKTKTYRAPLDSTTFSDLYMEVGDMEASGDMDVTVPLHLLTPTGDAAFQPFTFTLRFDPQCVQFKSVSTPQGSLLDGVPLTVSPVTGGMLISTTDRKLLTSTGTLLEFTFHTSDPQDTTCCDIEIIDASFSEGCFLPNVAPGEICIIPQSPVVDCDLDAPRELTWQRAIEDYLPNPFSVTGRFFNTGAAPAKNATYQISYDSSALSLVTPQSGTQSGPTPDIAPGNYHEVTWQLAAKRRSTGDSTIVCMTARFDNHNNDFCCVKIYIPPTEPILKCAMDVPVAITVDSSGGRYDPMPFPVTLYVSNEGGLTTDTVITTIIVPPDLRLAGPDAPDNNTKRLQPPILATQQSGSAQWMVEHPPTPVEKQYMIQVWVKTANTDSTMCEAMVTIPAMTAPFSFTVDADGPLSFCEPDSVTLQAPAGYASYKWSTGDTTRSIVVWTSGSYSCTVKTADGRTGISNTLQVAVHPLPAKPVIDRSGDVLTTGTSDAYQWLLDGQEIAGATQQSHVAVQTGNYRVRVTNEFGCENISDAFPVNVLGVEDAHAPATPRIDVYPDPAHHTVTVVVDLPRASTADVWLVDALGRSERIRGASDDRQQVKATIDLTGRSKGLYHILVLSGTEMQTRKFMVY